MRGIVDRPLAICDLQDLFLFYRSFASDHGSLSVVGEM